MKVTLTSEQIDLLLRLFSVDNEIMRNAGVTDADYVKVRKIPYYQDLFEKDNAYTGFHSMELTEKAFNFLKFKL